ncbi:hypothetical protein PG990_000146 [Apiospora arundinis]
MDSATSAPAQPSTPLFLRIPLEIRCQIYGYFLTVNPVFEDVENEDGPDSFESNVGIDFNDIYKFHLNRQIWSEAWDHLFRSNLWVQVSASGPSFEQHLNSLDYNGYSSLRFPSGHVPLEYQKRLTGELAMNVQMDKDDYQNETLVFAYHPLAYGQFAWALYLGNMEYGTLHIDLNASTVNDGGIFNKIVHPLNLVRGYQSVKFTGVEVESYTAVQFVSQAMMRPHPDSEDVEDVIEANDHYLTQGRKAEQDGHYSEAMCQFWLGIAQTYSPWEVFHVGSPKCNTLMELQTDLSIGLSRCAHKHVVGVKKHAPGCDIVASHIERVIKRGVQAADDALGDFVGLTEPQRRDGHLYLGLNMLHHAEHIAALVSSKRTGIKLIGGPEPSSEDISLDWEDEVDDYYLDAAREVYFATQVNPRQDKGFSGLHQYDRDTLEKIRKRPGRKVFEVAQKLIPLIGLWEGDPELWDRWDAGHRILMKQFRIRHGIGPDGERGRPEYLRDKYAAEGVTWKRLFNNRLSVTVQ